ncbi:MAG: permease [Fusobacteriaceae bacterium]
MDIFKLFADLIALKLFGLSLGTPVGDAVHFFIEDVTKILFLTYAVSFIISFFRSYLSPKKIRAYLEGKPKFVAYFLASALGAITPFCSCSSIPLFIGFVEAGIPFGITMSFLITSPLVNEIAIVILGASVGWKITWIYVATGMSLGIIGGFIMDKLKFERYIEKSVYEMQIKDVKERKLTFKQNFDYARYYAGDLVSKLWVYMIVGIAVGAFLHGFVPQSFFVNYLGKDNLFAVPIATILGLPLYAGATTVIPIAQALIGKGVPLGTVFALMMSVVGLSLPEFIILRKVMTKKLLGLFAGLMFIMIVFVGYFYNFIF